MKEVYRNTRLLIGGGIVVVTLVVVAIFFRPASNAAGALVVRTAAVSHAFGASLSVAFGRKPQPIAEIASCEKVLEDNAHLQSLLAENESLKTALKYQQQSKLAMVAAQVLAESSDESLFALIIDKGTADTVTVGQPVVAGNGVVVGKIAEARKNTSVVRLLVDSHSRLAVTVQGATDTLGVLQGDRGISAAVELIPQDATIRPGDTIVTSGIESGIARGLAVGIVEKVEHNSQDPFQRAFVRQFDDALHPIFVQVITQ